MIRAETSILLTVLLVGLAAFAIEGLGPEAARIIGIAFCLLLVSLMILGLFFRARMKRARAERAALEANSATPDTRAI